MDTYNLSPVQSITGDWHSWAATTEPRIRDARRSHRRSYRGQSADGNGLRLVARPRSEIASAALKKEKAPNMATTTASMRSLFITLS